MKKLPRMSGWLLIALCLVGLMVFLKPENLSIAIYKLTLVSMSAVTGYWIDRSLFPYARPNDASLTEAVERASAMLRRALIIGAVMLSVGLGL